MERVSLLPLFDTSARLGIGYGILFTLMSCCLLWCIKIQTLGMLLMILPALSLISIPRNMAVVASRHPSYVSLPALWISGIAMHICGAMICALATAVYLIFIAPDFLNTYVRDLLSVLKSNSNITITETGNIVTPTPMQFVGSMFWLTSFCGSVASFLIAAIMPRSPFFQRLVMHQQSKILNS